MEKRIEYKPGGKDMKFKNDDDNRYRVNFMVATEELMDFLTVKEFISYLEENAELEDDADVEYIDGKCVICKAYDLREENSNLHKEFLVTEDGRVFYWLSLLKKSELVDKEEKKAEVQKMSGMMRYKGMSFRANKNGTFTVTSENGRFKDVCKTFGQATSWIWNMADNHDIGNAFIRRICEKYRCNTEGQLDGTYEP